LLVSVIVLGVVFHTGIVALLAGAANTSQGNLHTSYNQALNHISSVGLVSKLAIGLFWAGVGVVGYFLVLTATNFFIALRNEVVVDTTFTNTGPLIARFRLPIARLLLVVVLAMFLLLTRGLFLPYWEDLAGHIILTGYSSTYLLDLLLAIIGLAVNIYLGWMLALVIKDLDRVA
jgi:hypothetical protein